MFNDNPAPAPFPGNDRNLLLRSGHQESKNSRNSHPLPPMTVVTLDLDLIVDVEAGVFPGEKLFDLFPAEAYIPSLGLDHHGLAFITYLKNNDLRSVGSAQVPGLHYTADGFFI